MIHLFAESTASTLLGALLIQLVTEPAPISSSTHVRIFLNVVERDAVPHLFGVLLMANLGMLVLLIFAYRSFLKKPLIDSWLREHVWLFFHSVWTTLLIPVAFYAKNAVALPEAISVRLMVTAIFLLISDRFSVLKKSPTSRDALWVGLAQSGALFFGTSRLATTYFLGRARGLSGSAALALSWIQAVPFFAGTGLIGALVSLHDVPELFTLPVLYTCSGALVMGYGILQIVIQSARYGRMAFWAVYLLPLSILLALLPST
jgi:undecaprenyl-diphosphatase